MWRESVFQSSSTRCPLYCVHFFILQSTKSICFETNMCTYFLSLVLLTFVSKLSNNFPLCQCVGIFSCWVCRTKYRYFIYEYTYIYVHIINRYRYYGCTGYPAFFISGIRQMKPDIRLEKLFIIINSLDKKNYINI